MNSSRLEAFTDGVVAIIITIMVLEIRVPQGADLSALREDVPLLLTYLLSYVIDAAGFTALPTASYGVVLALAAVCYTILEQQIIACNGPDSRLALAVGSDRKGMLSIALYVLAIVLAFARPSIAIGLYVVVALLWLVPDSRIESLMRKGGLSP